MIRVVEKGRYVTTSNAVSRAKMEDDTRYLGENSEPRTVSLYAEPKNSIEQRIIDPKHNPHRCGVRFSTREHRRKLENTRADRLLKEA